ncbi:hypothetical protein TVAG_417710 [Trichomonas vaginalis G3]|uniref:DnaK protein n=1 Tax=Trichomonas vaginalis (strain ATCC PRA-98 / G3) TaxID=412133 RepID=A2ED93_TRIV3|nr:ATP binding [Trichomonas vaginalis G3]EAY09351.1 hypothetical protein TVAG_417710 [Trichomonas vaginalis G3]KAI5501713.1 ATP binding [Trichomonas vaginalis G3]|eukprot:XP_001321574.1 hypothetical protein [Trichomonas vaginalis G3]
MSEISSTLGDTQDFVAIDFGGNRIKAYYVKDGKGSMISDTSSNKSFPTVISFLDKIRSWGFTAHLTDKSTIIEREKDFLFTKFESKLKSQKFLIDPITDNEGKVAFEVNFGDKKKIIHPIALLGYLINEICCMSPDSTVTDIVMVIPYWYTEEQKIAIKTAASIYDKSVFMISNTQGQVYDYIIRQTQHSTPPHVAAFIDFGYTNFVCSTYNIQPKSIRLLSRDKLDIGGRDITFALCDYILGRIQKEIKTPEVQDTVKLIKLNNQAADSMAFRNAVKNLKENLSSSHQIVFNPLGVSTGSKISLKVDRSELEKLPIIQDLKTKINTLIKNVRQGIAGKGKLNAIYLQGGSSKIPIIKKVVATSFGVEESKVTISRPDECFAEGAAFYHAKKRQHPKQREHFKINDDLVTKLKNQEEELNQIAENELKAKI